MTVTHPHQTASEMTAEAAAIAEAEPDPTGVVVVSHGAALVPVPPPSVDLPTIPGHNELQTLAQLAVTFAHSGLVPKALQGHPEDCLLVLLTARDLGLALTVAFRECHPIDGRVTVSPKLKLAMVRQRGLGRVWGEPDNDIGRQTWHAARADDPDTVYTVRFTWGDAQRAELVMVGCTAEDHSDQCRKGWGYGASRDQRAKACKQNWRTYPTHMLLWRAIGLLMDQAFGEVGVGLLGGDELGAVTDEDGRVIDIMESGPLEGMPDHTPAPAGPDRNEAAPADVRDGFKERIYRLPHPAIETLREQWSRRDDAGTPTLYPLPVLPLRQVKAAAALIGGFEARAVKGEWGPWTPEPLAGEADEDATTAASVAPGAPETPQVGSTEPEASTEPQDATPETAPEPAQDGPFDREGTARWLDSLDDLTVADMLTEYDLPGTGTKVAKRKRILDHLEADAGESGEDPAAGDVAEQGTLVP